MKCRKFIFATVTGLVTGFCFAAGKSLDVNYTLDLTQPGFYVKWLLVALLCGIIIHVLWSVADGSLRIPKAFTSFVKKVSDRVEAVDAKMGFFGIMLLIFVLWLPAWLSIFPGVFSYDAYDEWMQICNGDITAHHPVLHVLFLGGITQGIYQLTGNYNAGIAICTVIQMLLLAGSFSYTVKFMREQKGNPILRLFAVFFYACSPVVQLFAICQTKDTLFTAAFLLFVVSLYRICLCQEKFFTDKSQMILFGVSAVFTMILRNNGLYIVLISLVISCFVCRKKIKKYLIICGIVLAVYLMYIGPFYSVLDVTPGGKQEMLSVPLQQIARVYHYEKDTFTPEEIEYLHSIVPEENWNMYKSTVSDFVKVGFKGEVFEQDPGKFFRAWLNIGLKHPLTYINSFLIGTVDFWYPFAVVDGYQAENSSYFDYKVSEPGTEVVLLPWLHDIYESISHEHEAQTLPGVFLILSPGWYLLLFIVLFLYLWREKQYGKMFILLPILLNFGTVLLGPIALVRYVLILFFAFPIYSLMFERMKEK